MNLIRKFMNIGIFGGSFNPVHIGHVAVVMGLIEALRLDKVYIIPAACSPFKNKSDVSDAHRLAMCKRAFKEIPECKVLDIEIKRQAPSYTIDTIDQLKKTKKVGPKDKLFLLLGQDQLADFAKWKSFGRLITLTTPVVARRASDQTPGDAHILFVETPLFDVSATEIRGRLFSGQNVCHLLPNTVYNYIKRHKLYHD